MKASFYRWFLSVIFGSVALSGVGFAQSSEPRSAVIAPGVAMSFQWIHPGGFSMGSPESEHRRDRDEGPRTQVTISRGFYLGTYEVTQRQWEAVMGENPATFQQGENAASRPVETISWNDCAEFLERLSALGIGRFRLPTEAEWEYACRAGTMSRFYWGDIDEDWEAYPHAWTNSRSFATTHPVGTKPPNPWGLYDMSGNVWEWLRDWYAPYPDHDRVDPTGPETGKEKVFRGGSYYDFPHSLRSANRHRHSTDGRYSAIGLRVVWEPSPIGERDAITLPLPGGLPLELIKIPAGTFTMGSPDDEMGRQSDEGPMHERTIASPFYLGRFEITQAQWESVMGDNPSTFSRVENAPQHPVERVSWRDAQDFIAKLNLPGNQVVKGVFKLPSEAEWEYACRANSKSRFPWGEDDGFGELVDYAWFNSRAEGKSHPVGTKRPNPWGLFDMHGNVWEWLEDSFTIYPSEDRVGVEIDETKKVIRGGSWFNEPEALRSANRHRHPLDSRQTNLGFRVLWRPESIESDSKPFPQ